MALRPHARRHFPHPVHFFSTTSTPPPGRILSALSGHARAHGGSKHAWQTRREKVPSSPPMIRTRIADFSRDHSRTRVRVHAHIHRKHPMHRSRWSTRNLLLIFCLPCAAGVAGEVLVAIPIALRRSWYQARNQVSCYKK
jgi:hypothetical protein